MLEVLIHIINGERVAVMPRFRNYDVIDGGTGEDVIKLTDEADAIFLDDRYSPTPQAGGRIIDVEKIDAGEGNDVVDLTSKIYAVGDIEVNGEAGDDVLWTSSGNDTLSGGEGNDSI